MVLGTCAVLETLTRKGLFEEMSEDRLKKVRLQGAREGILDRGNRWNGRGEGRDK